MYEMLVGLEIKDNEIYQNYRDKMGPLLIRHGGGFRYDFKIAETLKSETDNKINRVFIIYFKNKQFMKNFFDNDEYRKIKVEYFESSVGDMTIISEYSSQTDEET